MSLLGLFKKSDDDGSNDIKRLKDAIEQSVKVEGYSITTPKLSTGETRMRNEYGTVYNESDFFTYDKILEDIYRFRTGIGTSNEWASILQESANYQFKLFFYFNDTVDETNIASGLLALTYSGMNTKSGGSLLPKKAMAETTGQSDLEMDGRKYTSANSAFNYLLSNAEYERADLLIQFIKLLSEINCMYPWTFQSISGLNEILNRTYFGPESSFSFDKDPEFTINCIQESYDHKIETLMSLYNSICFDAVNQREVVPANLRKFDMGVLLFNPMVKGFNSDKILSRMPNVGADNMHAFTKYIELHNCEFLPNQINDIYSDISNAGASDSTKIAIKIKVQNAKQNLFNEFLCRNIGDFILNDNVPMTTEELIQGYPVDTFDPEILTPDAHLSADVNPAFDEYARNTKTIANYGTPTLSGYKGSQKPKHSGFLSNTIKMVGGHALAFAKSKLSDLLLGNIYRNDFGGFVQGSKAIASSQNALQVAQQIGNWVRKKNKNGKHKISPTNINSSVSETSNGVSNARIGGDSQEPHWETGNIGGHYEEPAPQVQQCRHGNRALRDLY